MGVVKAQYWKEKGVDVNEEEEEEENQAGANATAGLQGQQPRDGQMKTSAALGLEIKFNIQYFILRRNINGGRLTRSELHNARHS